ncbi:MAG: ABC transporter permease [Chloroflexi bacterium]|nr:ABC transporter permease [Chloroflexota bacterium]MCY4246902.1 ABC transporter permease [Chloroflexota bacterium]
MKRLRRLFGSLFGQTVPLAGEWEGIAPERMTPRQRRLQRCSLILLWGALLNFLAVAAIVPAAIHAGNHDSHLFTAMQATLLPGLVISADAAALLLAAGTGVNVALLLLLSVAILAQEMWSVVGCWLAVALNLAALVWLGFAPSLLAVAPLLAAGILALGDLRAYRVNPVMLKELRGRLRGARGFAIITIFLTLMGFFTLLLYLLQIPQGGVVVTGELGRELFIGVLFIELMLIIFIVPALTAGAITNERERKTYDLLQTTLITKATFVVGKLQSALGYIVLLLLSAVPLQSIAFLFGGVSEAELLLALLVLLVSALTLGAFGMFFSSITERTLAATIRSYTVAIGITVGLPVAAAILFQNAYGNVVNNIGAGVSDNPTVEAATIYLDMIATSLNPIMATLRSQQMLIDHQQLLTMRVTLQSNGASIPVLSPWVLLTMCYLSLIALLVRYAIRRMERQSG